MFLAKTVWRYSARSVDARRDLAIEVAEFLESLKEFCSDQPVSDWQTSLALIAGEAQRGKSSVNFNIIHGSDFPIRQIQ
jgi:hypothetical protein